MKQRALLLINPHARKGKEAQMQAFQQLQALGFELLQESAENPQYLPEIIRQYRHMVDLVIISSGNEVKKSIFILKNPIGLIPMAN